MKPHFCRRLGFYLAIVACCLSVGCINAPTSKSRGAATSELPRDPNTLLVGAELALQRKQFRTGAMILAEAAGLSDEEALAERATKTAYEHYQYSFVLKSANRWLQINPTSEEARRFAGFAALRMYRIDEAAEHFNALLSSVFISPQAGFIALAPQWLQEGSQPAVLALMQALVPKYERIAEAHYVLAQAALQAENVTLALNSAQRAVELSPYWIPAKWLLARAQLIDGATEQGLTLARDALAQESTPEYRLEYAQLLYAAGKELESRREFEALSQEPDVAAGAQRALALMQLRLGQYDAAAMRLKELVKAGRFVYESMFYLAQIAERRKATGDAIELYSRVIDGEFTIQAQTQAARLRAQNGKLVEGIAKLQEFGRDHSEHVIDIITAQAAVLADSNASDQALELLNAGLGEYPDHDALRFAKALLLERMKRYSQAIEQMRALVRDRPRDPTALNMLGYTLVDRTRQTREGLELIRQALMMLPDNGAVLDSMGWALQKTGRSAEALDYLLRATQHARDPEISLHLGDVQWALGKHDDARTTWQTAFDDFPDNAALKERLEKRQIK